MKFVLLVALSALAVSNALVLKPLGDDHEEWELFKTKFERKYVTAEEELKRKLIFKDNLDFIRAHNKKYENHEETFAVAVNHFADMTNEEFRAKFNRFNPALKQRSTQVYKKPNNSTPEESVDWRDKGAVTAVKNQGDCGAGWAFSATGSIEAQNFLKTGSLISLSEQNLMDCSSKYGNSDCDSGRMDYAFQYVIDNGGIDTEESYPYLGQWSHCNYSPTNRVANISSFVDIYGHSEDDLQSAVSSVGPVSVGIDASELSFQFYFGGVYRGWLCGSDFFSLNHAVLVVGYGTQAGSRSRGGDYWIVKNSWGTYWGLDGYILMSRNNKNNCGIATQASYPVV